MRRTRRGDTACPDCGEDVIGRTWDQPMSFVELYACLAKWRWGHDAGPISRCHVTDGRPCWCNPVEVEPGVVAHRPSLDRVTPGEA
jgi:hypothetical protein